MEQLLLIALLVLLANSMSCTCATMEQPSFTCNQVERTALLNFKHNFSYLDSWVGEDCCSWKGVGCDNFTGHVVKLDLRVTGHVMKLDLRVRDGDNVSGGEVNPSLLKLKYLTYLDLSGNYFWGSRFPAFLGSMTQLQYLNLSYNAFSGKIPQNLGNLTKLVTLDLKSAGAGTDYWPPLGYMETNSLNWALKLKNLEHLDLGGIDLSQAVDSLDILHHLPSLSVLNLGSCILGNSHLITMRNSTIASTTLEHLDLSSNFLTEPIPHFLRNLSSLTSLDLSSNLFSSSIPSWFGNLTKLVTLDLNSEGAGTDNWPLGKMETNSLNWALKLKNLEHLDLGGIDLSQAVDSLDILHHLPSLSVLNLASCILGDSHLITMRNSTIASTTLEHLDLSSNFLTGPIPHFLRNLSSLTSLDLSSNQFSSSIPSWLANKTHLQYLSLSHNLFRGVDEGIMNILDSLCELKHLDLSYNQLQEDILEFDANLLRCGRSALQYLFLQSNNIGGQFPTAKSMLSLQVLDLSHNNFETIPASFGELFSLEQVDLSYNKLTVVHQVNLANLSRLSSLDISSNSIDLNISSSWLPPFQLFSLSMLPCKINSQFPKWLLSQQKISELDLSHTGIFGSLPNNIGNAMPSLSTLLLANNSIDGSIPKSLCKLASLELLDLHQNRLSGEIPDCWVNSQVLGMELSSNRLSDHIPNSLTMSGSLQLLSLRDNLLEGELPLSLSNCTALMVLDVGKNNFHGEVPSWSGEDFPFFRILILRENKFNGVIPPQLCTLYLLQIIDLASNNIVGTIPPCFGHFEGMGSIPDSSYSGEVPTIAPVEGIVVSPAMNPDGWDATIPPTEGIAAVNPDEWTATEVIKGEEREYTKTLQMLVNMDLSCNNLVGVIPAKIITLSLVVSLNLSHNHLMGTIPEEIGKMKSLESLDLSFNNLSGSIPESVSSIDSLSTLNFSFNNLQGRIPTGRHLETIEDPSTYMGNPGLCGDPLPKKCFGDNNAHPPTSMIDTENEEEENKHEKMWFYLVIILGFATGFWGVIGSLVLKKRWRYAYFQFAEDLADWLYVRVAVKIVRIKGGH